MATKTRPPTISDVARHARVSIATVSRVINRSAPVLQDTSARVQAAIAELAYIPHSAARVLASQKTCILGLLIPEISGAFFSPMLRGIKSEAGQAGYNLLIHTTQAREHTNQPLRALGGHNTDGLIVFTDSLEPHELSQLHKSGFPTVLL